MLLPISCSFLLLVFFWAVELRWICVRDIVGAKEVDQMSLTKIFSISTHTNIYYSGCREGRRQKNERRDGENIEFGKVL